MHQKIAQYMLIGLLVLSCSFISKNNNFDLDRLPASGNDGSCAPLIRAISSPRVISSGNVAIKATGDDGFSGLTFRHSFQDLGGDWVLQMLRAEENSTSEVLTIISKLESSISDERIDYRKIFSDLSEDEQRTLWNKLLRNEENEIRLAALQKYKENGNPLGTLLIEFYDRPVLRKQIEEAIVIIKELEPDASDEAIAQMIRDGGIACRR